MSKKVKNLVSEELRRRYHGVDSVLLIDPIGLGAVETNRLRGDLKARDIRLMVIKNSLARRALGDGPLGPLMDRLSGSNALASGGDSIVDVAKVIAEHKKQLGRLEIKGAVVEGTLFDAAEAARLATMPGKAALQAAVVASLLSPGGRLAAALRGPFQRIAGCIEAVAEKQEKDSVQAESESEGT